MTHMRRDRNVPVPEDTRYFMVNTLPEPAVPDRNAQARPSISLVSGVMRLGWTLAGSTGIFGIPTPETLCNKGV